MNPGNNFAQLSQCRKFGFGQGQGQGMGQGMGMGPSGSSGYAIAGAPALGIIGHEPNAMGGNASALASDPVGRGSGLGEGVIGVTQTGEPDVLRDLNPVARESGAVASDSVSDEYQDLVAEYFEAITTRKQE